MAYNINMGCTSTKITKRVNQRITIKIPDSKLRKTRLNLESVSLMDLDIFWTGTKSAHNQKIIPLLHIEDNPLRKNRLLQIVNITSTSNSK